MKLPVLDKNFYPMIKALNDFEAVVQKNGNPVEKSSFLWYILQITTGVF